MRTKAFKFISMAVLIVAIATAVIYVLMLLWNWLVPDLFSGPEITFWQAAGLLLLSKILFSGFNKKKHAMSQWFLRPVDPKAFPHYYKEIEVGSGKRFLL